MTLADVAPATIPTRLKPEEKWQVGDVVTVDSVRWKLRAISNSGRVVASSMNTSNVEIWWDTTLDILPKRETR